jgi:histidine triad (HIT) family protein
VPADNKGITGLLTLLGAKAKYGIRTRRRDDAVASSLVSDCAFCEIVAGRRPADVVLDEPEVLAFLDQRPVFPGHTLLVPRLHVEGLDDLPPEVVAPLFDAARRLSRAVRAAVEADGSFVAVNNHISQSVPHLHVHILPRRRRDGLRGFFWPRFGYEDEVHRTRTAAAIRSALRAAR